jgi:hypothetical protein
MYQGRGDTYQQILGNLPSLVATGRKGSEITHMFPGNSHPTLQAATQPSSSYYVVYRNLHGNRHLRHRSEDKTGIRNYLPIIYYWTGLLMLDHSCLVGNLTSSKIAETIALELPKS